MSNITQISIVDWIDALLIVVSLFALLISIPSFISMYKLGFKAYIEQLLLLKTMIKKISSSYKIIQNPVYTYSGGPSTKAETNHFFPIVINKDNILILNKKEGPFNKLHIQYCKYIDGEWNSNIVERKTSNCLLTQILNDKLQNKIDNLMKESVQLNDVENLNQLLNSEITSIKREDILNTLLND